MQAAEWSSRHNKVVGRKPSEPVDDSKSQHRLMALLEKHRTRQSQKELTLHYKVEDLREKSAKRQ